MSLDAVVPVAELGFGVVTVVKSGFDVAAAPVVEKSSSQAD